MGIYEVQWYMPHGYLYDEVVIDDVDDSGERQAYIEMSVTEADRLVRLHVEDNNEGVDVKLALADVLILINHLTAAAQQLLA
jgi:hypothetical protein